MVPSYPWILHFAPKVGVINERKTNHANHANHGPIFVTVSVIRIFGSRNGSRCPLYDSDRDHVHHGIHHKPWFRSNVASIWPVKDPLSAKMLLNHGFYNGHNGPNVILTVHTGPRHHVTDTGTWTWWTEFQITDRFRDSWWRIVSR